MDPKQFIKHRFMYSGGVWFNGPRFLYLQCLQFLVSGFFGPFAIKNSNDFCLASLQVGSSVAGEIIQLLEMVGQRDEMRRISEGVFMSLKSNWTSCQLFSVCQCATPDFGDLQSCCLPTWIALVPSFCDQIYRKYRYFASIKLCFSCRSGDFIGNSVQKFWRISSKTSRSAIREFLRTCVSYGRRNLKVNL